MIRKIATMLTMMLLVTLIFQPTPNIEVKASTTFDTTKIATNSSGSLLIKNGDLYASGNNKYYRLGLPTTTSYKTLTKVDNPAFNGKVVEVAMGEDHSLILTNDKQVYVVGSNIYGQLGTGNTTAITTYTKLTNVNVSGKAVGVRAGHNSSFILTDTNDTYAFGRNVYYQLGLVAVGDKSTPTLITHANLAKKIVDVKVNFYTTMFLTSDKKLYGVGYNAFGNLGPTINKEINQPTPTLILSSVDSVAIGDYSSLIVSGSTVYSYGYATDGLPATATYGSGEVCDDEECWQETWENPVSSIQTPVLDGVIKAVRYLNRSYFLVTDKGSIYSSGYSTTNGHHAEKLVLTKIPSEYANPSIFNPRFIVGSTGIVKVMGSNSSGELGLGDLTPRPTYTLLNGFTLKPDGLKETSVGFNLQKGDLALEMANNVQLNQTSITLKGGKEQVVIGDISKDIPYVVRDGRGTGEGWRVQVVASNLVNVSDGKTLEKAEIGLKPITSVNPYGDNSNLTGVSIVQSTYKVINTPEPTTLVKAQLNAGIGAYQLVFPEGALEIIIPSDVKVFSSSGELTEWKSTVTWTVVTGP